MANQVSNVINSMRLKRLQKQLTAVNRLSDQMRDYSDEALQAKTAEFKQRLEKRETTLDKLLPEAYATIREASKRVLGMYPKDVQVMGAIVMHQGNIAEMQTGEGKTLTATMPLYLNALTGKSAFLITTNDYLANRDFQEMRPLYEWLGLTASLGFVDIPDYEYADNEKQMLYNHDIIYTTNGRLGFDYLFDNLADHINAKYLPELNFAIIDEVDSIILDAAQTPLVISGAPRVQSNLFHIIKMFVETLVEDEHFKLNVNKKEVWLTDKGIDVANHYFKVNNIYLPQYFDLVRVINLSLRAKYLFKDNLDYFIYNGEVVLIDRITGRMLPGTKLQSGLHQAIEAKEGVELSQDLSVMATITFQNLFKLFNGFSGMTGTGKLGEKEFFDLYSKLVVEIPTNHPIIRNDKEDRVYAKSDEKNKAILEKVKEIHATKQPVLLITRTAEVAEYFSTQLFKDNIPNNLLIAQNVAKEAQMIAEAGQLGAVTVSTSMAGRGTDIKLGSGVYELGGLAVIINEHMENSRVDRQLRGRSGRQGDPGVSQIYVSLDDYIVKRWSNSKLAENEKLKDVDPDKLQDSPFFRRRVRGIVSKAQRVSEETAMMAREMANEFEKSIGIQRDRVYEERNRILETSDFSAFDFDSLARDVFDYDLRTKHIHNKDDIIKYIYEQLSFSFKDDAISQQIQTREQTIDYLVQQFNKQLKENMKIANNDYFKLRFLQKAILKAIDVEWINQVDQLQQLKASVNNRQNGQRNAIFEYHKVALETYEMMLINIKRATIRNLCLSILTFDKDQDLVVHFP
ncbi:MULTISPECIES: accessory Sec system translocase SecA2 [Staphylococcus]|uniref:Protein translocase subunit SecA n=1 Tax=Staphylococcus haemolyticus TaxID=1283 RepID=A0A7Z1SCJ1_STAHA|nr:MULTISPECIES: accessory Sec system translocase SecA2 [Staphylococcus]MBD3928876.1 accessory Sec system translocase SecA2 [Staphylococcus haemolyticus]MBK3923899.1 accessory Sec system translocase SecA2 [Staphylococcus haemolyticus]MBK3948416.1 accessory Sec system translocase SecA2 [Staphylococcus haemolyticus]MBK3953395.1 accessory Sec system translocase SecA2 [Staphylococcus haemolyticus]MBW5903433.1 accessory Sec system translocase SecA2 [Staphylococcus haemolyticus]